MSIHAFHSKLMSGKEEGNLFDGLRRLRSVGSTALSEAAGWTYWTETTASDGSGAEPGWAVWEEEGSSAMSQA
ncbi:MAG TPA: hypothetical protein VFR31_04930 [Thermoanaerobaculia bacterium]|nr:hypothetical protein [Thermoanaerobaculia bacterium]